ncbi:MAG: transcriptional regulator [Actinobacteria bacterium]|nr:transcriptional regulator [Actinomycetota bacterium]
MSTMTSPTDIACCRPVTEAALDDASAIQLAAVFAVLGDPVRLRLFSLIASLPDGSCACDLVEPLGRSQPTVSHHLKVLFESGLVDRERRGRWIWYSVRPEALASASILITC